MSDSLESQIKAELRYPKTRDEIIAIYQKKYTVVRQTKKGKIEEWRGKLAKDLSPFTRDKHGNPLKAKNVQRRFQTGREKAKISPGQQAEYAALGATLDPIMPPGGFKIEAEACVLYSGECPDDCKWVYINQIVSGRAAEFLMRTYDAQAIVNLYNLAPYDSESAPGTCFPVIILSVKAIY